LRIVFHIAIQGDGLAATMDSPDQGAYGIAVDTVSFDGTTFRCEIKRIRGDFEGKLKDDGSLGGFWTQFDNPMALSLQRKVATARKRPQEPAKPYPYTEEDVTFANTKAGLKLAGTFTKPNGGKRFPVVLLISGSGPQDRNGEFMAHKPFLLWADTLTRRGFAVLRVDDRGVGASGQAERQATSEDLAQDAMAGIAYLKTRRDIDKKRIGLIGHSEGGLIAPLVAVQSKDVAFIVLLAAPGARGVDVLAKQRDAMLAARGVPENLRAQSNRIPQRLTTIAMESPDTETAVAKFDAYWAEVMKQVSGATSLSDAQTEALNAQADVARSELKGMMSPWIKFYLQHDPALPLQRVRVPVLALNGSLDTQVVASQNLPLIEAALKSGGNKDYKVIELPGLNHLLQAAKTGVPSEYMEIEETINPAALQTAGDWLTAHGGSTH
ncbi:MAG TPA: alpha/beta fold hydrolase, partial [Steroidobacteraceae bacterium]|nr:alpha/beta fold hydrolase [Steroidobacteraceae bacterium]